MTYENKPNTGNLFPNNNRISDNHPAMTGQLHLDKTFIIEQMNKANGPLVSISIAAWNNTSKNGLEYLGVRASEVKEKKEESLPY
jgi:hypothetical protein